MTLSLVLSSQSYNLSFQIITCDYEQDNFGKTIELTLEIYAKVKKVETNNLACLNEMKCGGTLSIPYEGGKERNKWIKDELKDQALKLFTSANFIDGKPENNFKVQVDFEKLDAADRKKYLGTKAENPQKLCGCIPKTKAIKPIHDEISNNVNEHFSDVIARPAQRSIQSLIHSFTHWRDFWQVAPLVVLGLPFFLIPIFFGFLLSLLILVPFSILTGIHPF